jgi:hypothetical protein
MRAGGKVLCVGRRPTETAEGAPLSAEKGFVATLPFVQDESAAGQALQQSVLPDFRMHTGGSDAREAVQVIGFIRRKLADGDIYFIANTGNTTLHVRVTFQTRYAAGQQVSAESGERVGGSVRASDVAMTLAPYESRVFLFSAAKLAPIQNNTHDSVVADLSADWKVTFSSTGKTQTMRSLTDWTADPHTLHYSGEVVYAHPVRLERVPSGAVVLSIEGGRPVANPRAAPVPEHALNAKDGLPDPLVTRSGPGMRAWFDPPIRAAALLYVNGQPAGALWHPPYRLDVTKYMHAGDNLIELHVYNTLMNAWSAQPPHDYGPLKAKYGDRFQMQGLQDVIPVSSGLLGTVQLVSVETAK